MKKSKMIITICAVTIANSIALAQLPDHFDWRNVNGKNYMSPVKAQGDCGSCGPFAAVGAVEAQYNIFWDWPEYDIDLSEEHLVSNNCFPYDCRGGLGSQYDALLFIMNSGITDEDCFPYVDYDCTPGCGCAHGCSNAECSDRCAEWNVRLWKIDGVVDVDDTVEAIKNYIYNTGPLVVVMDWWDGELGEDDILRCDPDNSYDHAVIITGWDETDDYWIVKNSQGADWGPDGNGYLKVGFGECLIEDIPYGATLSNPDTDKFYIKNSSGETVAWFGNRGNLVLKGTKQTTWQDPSGENDEFIIEKNSGPMVYIDDSGNLFMKGNFTQGSPPSETGANEFRIQDSEGNDVAIIKAADGSVHIKGKLYQHPNP